MALLLAVAGRFPLLAADSPGDANNGAPQHLQWWTDARFGMFIHWGLYSQWGCQYPGTNGTLINGGSAHMMQRLQIP
ncbi:MAG TPA: alpha-L-fucosidase, partial [Candidatus Binatia bacterium]|nr:alpha-L-fucosidase [Candidatus Binatia bacterium]